MAERGQPHGGLVLCEQVLGDAVVVSAVGTIDLATASQFEQHIAATLHRHPSAMIIELSGVEFLAAVGITVLLRIHDITNAIAFVVVADGPATSRPLRLLGIDKIIRIYPTLAEARQALNIASSAGG